MNVRLLMAGTEVLLRDVLAIALPLVIQTAFWSVMWFIDRMYLMWYSKESMAATLPAGSTST